ncbi:hypothetical protein BJF78_05210 [Pseudonocardia sp. CNS-139]|nr:hypothetical protein BJF78_05210 [Pseudonocardia sp. CNS-139]
MEVSGMEWSADDDQQLAEMMRRHDAGEDVETRPGETAVPYWVMATIILGLVSLTGSVFAVVVVVAFGAVWWLLRTAETTAPHEEREDDPSDRGPFGGPGIWL